MTQARTLGELKKSGSAPSGVKEEMRRNLLRKLAAGETLFPGILGYEESVVPQVANAILSRHNMILLGLRGQAKSRLLRSLTTLLDPRAPRWSRAARSTTTRSGRSASAAASSWRSAATRRRSPGSPPSDRYVEKLATPDVTIADIIGDVDPIRAARGGHDLASELTMHYGLLPRAHRGIFALNELPDLAGRIQVGLFNILQEGDVQIKGYPVRLPLDVCMVFTANPEDYTARGKIITPLKDRIGSEIRTHYPATVEQGVAITQQEAWTERGRELRVPRFIREVAEGIAFAARRDKKIDKRSGVSQRLPITALENAVSNAERRALLRKRGAGGAARLRHLRGAALPHRQVRAGVRGRADGRGERGPRADPRRGGRGLLRLPRLRRLAAGRGLLRVGRHLKLREDAASARRWSRSSGRCPASSSPSALLGVGAGRARRPCVAAAAEFVLEGLYGQKKIGRSDDRGFVAPERRADAEVDLERLERLRRMKKQVN